MMNPTRVQGALWSLLAILLLSVPAYAQAATESSESLIRGSFLGLQEAIDLLNTVAQKDELMATVR